MFGFKWIELAILAAFAFFVIAIAAPSWARTTLENQSLEAQCRYKATVTESIVVGERRIGGGSSNVWGRYDHETTPAERALIQQYIAEARQYASRYATNTPEEAKLHMFNLCMGFARVGSAEPPEGIRLPPVELPELNYHHEWCWNLGSDARLIAQALKNRMPPEALHMNIESVDYFSPQRKLAAHNLVNSAVAAMEKNTESPGQWFKRITDECMAEAHGG